MAILANSRNLLTSTVTVLNPINGQPIRPTFVNLRARVEQTAPDDQFITSDSAHSWGAMGLVNLGDARFWWSIADLSDVVDPFEAISVAGVQFRGPSVPRLLFTILAPSNTTT